jgi:pimeloyl-ACP methyl ester carboxylesterase
VEPVIDNASYLVPLHFVHHRSHRNDAIPLLFIHGWPGSFLEVSNIIGNLTNPPNASLPAFHVVAPSIPGFGFSPTPQKPGFGPVETSHAFNELMCQLGYSKCYSRRRFRWGYPSLPGSFVSEARRLGAQQFLDHSARSK